MSNSQLILIIFALVLVVIGVAIAAVMATISYRTKSRVAKNADEGVGNGEVAAVDAVRDAALDGVLEPDLSNCHKSTIQAPNREVCEAQDDRDIPQPAQVPAPVTGRMVRLRSRLAQSGALGRSLLSVLSRAELCASDWEEIEDTLLLSDLGVEASEELLESLRTQIKITGTSDNARAVLADKLLELVDPNLDRSLRLESPSGPATVLVVGVNGTGKTTVVGRLARILVAQNKKVILGAGDTFRAGAAKQLRTWGERIGVEVVASEREGGDPAAVAFDAQAQGRECGADVVLIDTAGRLQNKSDLMDELGKVKRVLERQGNITETLLVLDATIGQNGLRQAQIFAQVVDVSGIVLTKLDGSAKGGIVVSVQRELGVPVKLVGLGEGLDDLAPFDPQVFVEELLRG